MTVPTLSVHELGSGELSYRLEISEGSATDPLEEAYALRLGRGAQRAFKEGAERLLRGAGGPSFDGEARQMGSTLYNSLVPRALQARLKEIGGHLLIRTPIVGMPWEIFFDGDEFWGLRYALGRRLLVEGTVEPLAKSPTVGARPRALIVGADAGGRLPFVTTEVEKTYEALRSVAQVTLVSGRSATLVEVLNKLQLEYDIIHYCGHISAKRGGQPGLALADELLPASLIRDNLTGHPIVFLNGCASARDRDRPKSRQSNWEKGLSSVAHSFLAGSAGRAAAVVGTLCDVTDEQANRVAVRFYEYSLGSLGIGEALRRARNDVRASDPHSPSWLSFVLYGNPKLSCVRIDRVRRLVFAHDGTPIEAAWQDDARRLLQQARAEALGHGAEKVSCLDLAIALLGSPLFRAVLARRGKSAITAVPLMIRKLRADLRSSGPVRPPEASTRRQQLDASALVVVAAANESADAAPIGTRDLLRALCTATIPALDEAMEGISLDRAALLGEVDATPDPEPAANPPVETARHPVAEAKPGKREPEPLRLFDAAGDVRAGVLSRPVLEILTAAFAEADAAADPAIEPLHLLVALMLSPHVQRGLGLDGEERTVMTRLGRAALYATFGKHSDQVAGPATLPLRRQFTAAGLALLDGAARAAGPMLDWPTLLAATVRVVRDEIDALGHRDPQVVAILRQILDRLTPVAVSSPTQTGREHRDRAGRDRSEARAASVTGGGAPAGSTSVRGSTARAEADFSEDLPNLHRFGRDLIAAARAGRFSKLVGRDEQLRQIALVLARKEKSSVLLLGPAGVGKTAIVEGLALSILDGTAPLNLRGRRIFELDTSRLVAGTALHGELEARVQVLLEEIESHPDVILFIDEFHTFVGAGGYGDRTALTLGNQLKAALGRGGISVIGATTEQEYSLSVDRDPALRRRFRIVRVPPSSPEETLEILRRIRGQLEGHYGVAVQDEALVAAVMLADRYLPGNMPDSARDVVVDACAALLVEAPAGEAAVSEEIVRELVARTTGIPRATLSPPASEAALSPEAALGRRVVGQEEAVRRVAARLRAARVVRDPGRPVAVFLFTGPSGVGKTELARSLAIEYCGSPEAFTAIPMNEYGERLTLSRLIGVGPGWVGHDEEPVLLGALRKRPRCVVVLDEIDKAHPDAWKLLMRLFDEGRLADPRGGSEVSGREAIFVMTANIALAAQREVGFGTSDGNRVADARASCLRHFAPEFVNRIDDVIEFDVLTEDAVARIAEQKLAVLADWVRQEHRLEVEIDPAVAGWLARRAYAPEFGARQLGRTIESEVREPLSVALLGGLGGATAVRGHLRGDSVVFEALGPDTADVHDPSSP